MIEIVRASSDDPDFRMLAALLTQELRVRDGVVADHYAALNRVEGLAFVVVAYLEGVAVGCGAVREYDGVSMEVKRMYVSPDARGRGIATVVLGELERWAFELGYRGCVLETGKNQPEAIALYERNGYRRVPLFGRYVGSGNSVCFSKELAP